MRSALFLVCVVSTACDSSPIRNDNDNTGADNDQDGFVAVSDGGDDCDDGEASINPAADEICDNIDQDCDGEIDNDASDASTYFADTDSDGFGSAEKPVLACSQPEGAVANDDDCDDGVASVFPGAEEVCNGIDDNCDQVIDDDVVNPPTWYLDADGDGYGTPAVTELACEAPADYVDNDLDCNDGDQQINPDTPWYADTDGDGYGDATSVTTACVAPVAHVRDDTDCNDANGRTNPGFVEVCDDLDNDCDGTIDDGSDGCAAYEGTYSGTYYVQAQERIGSSVINDMECTGTFDLTVDYSQDPPVTGSLSCSHSRYPVFNSLQTATFEGDVGLDGVLTGTTRHTFNSFSTRRYPTSGDLVDPNDVTFDASGTMRPSSFSAIDWQVTVEGDGAKE